MDIQLNEIIDSYNQYIARFPTGCMGIVELFNQGQSLVALKNIADLSEGIEWLIQAKNYLLLNGVKVDWNEYELINFLEEINKGLELQDYVLVSDLMEYEIVPFFENRKIINEI